MTAKFCPGDWSRESEERKEDRQQSFLFRLICRPPQAQFPLLSSLSVSLSLWCTPAFPLPTDESSSHSVIIWKPSKKTEEGSRVEGGGGNTTDCASFSSPFCNLHYHNFHCTADNRTTNTRAQVLGFPKAAKFKFYYLYTLLLITIHCLWLNSEQKIPHFCRLPVSQSLLFSFSFSATLLWSTFLFSSTALFVLFSAAATNCYYLAFLLDCHHHHFFFFFFFCCDFFLHFSFTYFVLCTTSFVCLST